MGECATMFATNLIDAIGGVSPFLGTLLGGPAGNVVGSLISSVLGGIDMSNPENINKALQDPNNAQKLKELELQLMDLQNARNFAQKESNRWVRPFLALLAMLAVFVDIVAIQYVTDKMLNEILIMMLVFLIWDIRQIYKFYFGASDELPSFIRKR
jgi:hypothetical protein